MPFDKLPWTQNRIEELITNGAEESVYLEFKAGEALAANQKREIIKDVSAFANSDGGVLIYGIAEKDHKAESISFIDGNAFTKEWLEQVISDGIQRRIEGIRIHPIRFDGDIQKTVYVVEIPVSDFAPHMTKDNRYFKRYNFQSVPMQEYEVRQTFDRKKNVRLSIGEVSIGIIGDKDLLKMKAFNYGISINISNVGQTVARDYRLKVYMPSNIVMHSCDSSAYNTTSEILGHSVSTIKAPVVYPGEELNVMQFNIGLPYDQKMEKVELDCYIYTESGYTNKVVDITKKVLDLRQTGFQALPPEERSLLDRL